MLDIKWIRENQNEFDKMLRKRGIGPMSEKIAKLDGEKRKITNLIQEFQHARKVKSKIIASMSSKFGEDYESLKNDVEHINEKLEDLENDLKNNDELNELLQKLPNIPDQSVPYGTDENGNILLRNHGEIKNTEYTKQHFELGETLGLMDFTQAAKMSGSRFVILKGDLAKLERALANFMLDTHTEEYGFLEVAPPALVRDKAMYHTGQLPNLAQDSFVTTNNYRLIPTSEVSLVNIVADTIIAREKLPIRYTAYTSCFRSEAGSSGRDTRGMIRLHQFGKVELVSITTPEEAKNEHEYITNAAENILKKLDLPYRVMLLCTGDMGFAAQKTYDLEVWLPGQRQYREISSCSNCGDFQARRMKARYKEFGSSETTLVHTLNGSGLPTGRTIVAILENYQNADGSITVPDALVGYMGGLKKIEAYKE